MLAGRLARARRALDDQAAAVAWAEGQAMTPELVVAEALGEEGGR